MLYTTYAPYTYDVLVYNTIYYIVYRTYYVLCAIYYIRYFFTVFTMYYIPYYTRFYCDILVYEDVKVSPTSLTCSAIAFYEKSGLGLEYRVQSRCLDLLFFLLSGETSGV